MSKYTILNGAFSVVATANTLHMAKRAFYDEVKADNLSSLILLDENLDSYAIFRGGKVVAGRKWQAFVKSSYNVPKAAPAPMAVVPQESYTALQAKWLAKNNLKVGDEVKIVKATESYKDGWDNNWCALGMDKQVGKVGKILGYTSLGVHVETDDKAYSYHFDSLQVVPTVKRVCQDVIDSLNAEKLMAITGNTVQFKGHIPYNESAQEFIQNNSCSVCAKGAILTEWVRKFNKLTVRELARAGSDSLGDWPADLVELFGVKLLDEIEVAFERFHSVVWCDVPYSRRQYLSEKYHEIVDNKTRMIKIMQDIINDDF